MCVKNTRTQMNSQKNLFTKTLLVGQLLFVLNFLSAQNQPNIIWLVCEDQSPGFFPMYGDDTASLPNLKALAEDSVVYDNMHATTPVCSPARSAIITGMYPTTLGTHNMRTFNEGRTTNQPQLGIPSYSPKFPDYIKPFTIYLREAGYYCTNSNKQDYNFKVPQETWDQTCRYCQGAEKQNIHWRNRAPGQPFFAVFNFQITHESKIWEQQDNELFVAPDAVNVPPYFPDDAVVRKDMAVNYSNLVRMDRELGAIIDELKEQGLYDDAYIFFYSDHGGPFPRHKRAIYDTGTKVPMMIKMPKNAAAKTRNNDLWSFIDLAPTVLDLAQLDVPEHIQGLPMLNKSTKPRAHLVTASDRFDGQVDRIRSVKTKRYKFIKNYNPDQPHALDVNYRKQMPMMRRLLELEQQGVLSKHVQRWFDAPKPQYEFYDLLQDPYELSNLAMDAAHRERLLQFNAVLDQWISETNDLGERSEQEIIDYSVNQ